jgi:hypothetical protein
MNFREAIRNKNFKIEFIVTITLLVIVLILLSNFLNSVEAREGITFPDPFINLFEPVDLTWLTFGLIYIALFTSLYFFLKEPVLLVTAIQSYIILVVFRIIAMYLVPLNPPEKMIPLADPFVEFFGTGQLLTKDLFFSGHTAILFLLYLLAEKKSLRIYLLVSTVIVALSVLLQHVHYSIDVFVAPFFAYCSFVVIKNLRRRIFFNCNKQV